MFYNVPPVVHINFIWIFIYLRWDQIRINNKNPILLHYIFIWNELKTEYCTAWRTVSEVYTSIYKVSSFVKVWCSTHMLHKMSYSRKKRSGNKLFFLRNIIWIVTLTSGQFEAQQSTTVLLSMTWLRMFVYAWKCLMLKAIFIKF